MEWQPIETAPKDKTVFLAYGLGHGNRCFGHQADENPFPMFSLCHWGWIDNEEFEDVGNGTFVKVQRRRLEGWMSEWAFTPTHWMPLPEAPKD